MNKIVRFMLLASLLHLAMSINDEQKGHIQEKFKSVGETCVKEYPLTDEDISALKERKFPDNENAGCFTSCVLRNIGFFDDNGTLSKESALEHAKEVFGDGGEVKTVEEFFETCSKVNDEPIEDDEKGCKRAKVLFDCFIDNLDKFDF